jgi:hypothetical protein
LILDLVLYGSRIVRELFHIVHPLHNHDVSFTGMLDVYAMFEERYVL